MSKNKISGSNNKISGSGNKISRSGNTTGSHKYSSSGCSADTTMNSSGEQKKGRNEQTRSCGACSKPTKK